ncbi:MAG: GNAT family N-acetyltransferase [Peptococcaceae bacterium]|nr:GNAT family N-acetyltransferase [Peptococcaceae bacterium]
MTREISLGRWVMRDEMAELWRVAFQDSEEATQHFFNYRFQPENSLVYLVDGKVSSMLHMLPVELVVGEQLEPAQYIYGAATWPVHRGVGHMGALLAAAAACGQWRGEKYSLLLPMNPALYLYYAKHQYQPFFQTRYVNLTREEMQSYAKESNTAMAAPTMVELAAERRELLATYPGSVIWGEQHLAYAAALYELYGGKFISLTEPGGSAYAMGINRGNGEVELVEVVATPALLGPLAREIVRQMPAVSYYLRLPAFGELWAGQGEVRTQGMLKALTDEGLLSLQGAAYPYLGLTLD